MIRFLCATSIFITARVLAAVNSAPLHVFVDPGHGGSDHGAVYGDAREASLVLSISLKLKQRLKSDSRFKLTLSREDDKTLSLTDRVNMAENSKADILISIHANAASDQRVHGAEIYFQNHLPPDEESLFLANLENQKQKELAPTKVGGEKQNLSKKGDVLSIVEDLKRQKRMQESFQLSRLFLEFFRKPASIKQAPFQMVVRTSIPSILIELGFLTNPQEAEKMLQTKEQNEIAEKLASSLIKYKEILDNKQSAHLQ